MECFVHTVIFRTFGENFGILRTLWIFLVILRTFWNFSYILGTIWIVLAWNFPKIDGIVQEFSVHFSGCTRNFWVANPLHWGSSWFKMRPKRTVVWHEWLGTNCETSSVKDGSDRCQVIHIAIVCTSYNSTRFVATTLKSLLFYRKNPVHLHFIADPSSRSILEILFDTWDLQLGI